MDWFLYDRELRHERANAVLFPLPLLCVMKSKFFWSYSIHSYIIDSVFTGSTTKLFINVKWSKDEIDTGFSVDTRIINELPYIPPGACQVNRKEGTPAITLFKIQCIDVFDDDKPLKYYFYYKDTTNKDSDVDNHNHDHSWNLLGVKQGKYR